MEPINVIYIQMKKRNLAGWLISWRYQSKPLRQETRYLGDTLPTVSSSSAFCWFTQKTITSSGKFFQIIFNFFVCIHNGLIYLFISVCLHQKIVLFFYTNHVRVLKCNWGNSPSHYCPHHNRWSLSLQVSLISYVQY